MCDTKIAVHVTCMINCTCVASVNTITHDINMADESLFYGTWKIVECVSLTGTVEPTGIEGTVFRLDEAGDVSWSVSEDAEPMPFFSCETYEVTATDSASAMLKFFGTFAGHIIEFRVEVSDDLMLLTYERCCMLQCQKVSSSDSRNQATFSLLGALEEGYFSDLTIVADCGKKFAVHTSILQLALPLVDWTTPPLSGLPAPAVATALHYLYAECLPPGLSEDTARACLEALRPLPAFHLLTALCEKFLQNTALRQQIASLVQDMHACADRIIDLFSGKVVEGQGSPPPLGDGLMTNPAKLCYVVKQALRETAVAGLKLLILCDLFSRRKGELSREERHQIIKYAKSRLPVFMNQLRQFLEVCRLHSSSLTLTQRHEIATYLVPEIESTLDTISTFVSEMRTALEQVISASGAAERQEKNDKSRRSSHIGDVLGRSLRNALHMRELMKMKIFHEKMSEIFRNLVQKKDNFSQMSPEEKVRSVAKNLEQLIDEVPLFLVRVEELMSALDEKVTWREWKYLFKLGTSKVAWGLSKMQAHRTALASLIDNAKDTVAREQFTQSLVTLGLQGKPTQDTGAATCSVKTTPKYAQLSAVESLCKSPNPADSKMAAKCLDLLHSARHTDMIFDIVQVHECAGDVVIDAAPPDLSPSGRPERPTDVQQVSAHCVIIAARCDWFRRALLSGMRESIDKKITLHDTNATLFRLFLSYLYSGQLDVTDLSTEQLADLITLSDRYEVDSLKCQCEHALERHIDEHSVLYLFSLADQFDAKTLRGCALNFILEHPCLAASDVFEELPEHLQVEVEDVTWNGLGLAKPALHPQCEQQTPTSSGGEMDDLMTALDLDHHHVDYEPSSVASAGVNFVGDVGRLETCVAALRDVVGEAVAVDVLVDIAIAADYDLNRALNFFFSG